MSKIQISLYYKSNGKTRTFTFALDISVICLSKEVLDVSATPADHLGQPHGLQVADCPVHHLCRRASDFHDDGELQLLRRPRLVRVDPGIQVSPEEKVPWTQIRQVGHSLDFLL